MMTMLFQSMNSTIKLLDIDRDLQEKVRDLFTQFEQTASRFIKDNELAHVNQSPLHVPVHLDETIAELLDASLSLSRKVNYVVNPFLGNIMKSVGYTQSFHPEYAPVFEEKDSLKTGFYKEPFTQIAKQWIIKEQYFSFDFGGFGKGYIVDKAMNLLKKEKISKALVNAGGDLAVIGRYQVGIEHPVITGTDMMRFSIENLALATSGKNFRRWDKDGKPMHHIVNGQTGEVAENGIVQASAIAKTVMEAETISKLFCILPYEEAKKIVKREFPRSAYFVYFDHNRIAVGGDSTLYEGMEVAQ